MRTFDCACGNKLYFENSACLKCGGELGYLPDRRVLARLRPSSGDNLWTAETAAGDAGLYRKCSNYTTHNVCNWMVPASEPAPFCHACRLNRVIPDLSSEENSRLWFRIEQAKRRLIYTLDMLGLPVFDKSIDEARGLAFDFLKDDLSAEGCIADHADESPSILTGHGRGVITINLCEADPQARERMREKLGEDYRTLLGHFRHETGHYYWDLLVRDTEYLEKTRSVFGDERQNYDEVLELYYASGPRADWPDRHITAYASAHPWEDWAETWAHYLHMADTLETAHEMGLSLGGRRLHPIQPGNPAGLVTVLENWVELTDALNMLNRSMGLPDAYPFAIGPKTMGKLQLIDEIIANAPRLTSQFMPPS